MGAEHSQQTAYANTNTPHPTLAKTSPLFADSSATLTAEPDSFDGTPRAAPIPIPQPGGGHARLEQRRHTLPALAGVAPGDAGLRRFSLASAASLASVPVLSPTAAQSPTNSTLEYVPFASYRGQSLRRLSTDSEIKAAPAATQVTQPLQHQVDQPSELVASKKPKQQLPVDFVAWASFD